MVLCNPSPEVAIAAAVVAVVAATTAAADAIAASPPASVKAFVFILFTAFELVLVVEADEFLPFEVLLAENELRVEFVEVVELGREALLDVLFVVEVKPLVLCGADDLVA